jgi:hypothetical protein
MLQAQKSGKYPVFTCGGASVRSAKTSLPMMRGSVTMAISVMLPAFEHVAPLIHSEAFKLFC